MNTMAWRRTLLALAALGCYVFIEHGKPPQWLSLTTTWLWVGTTVAVWIGGFRHLGHPLQRFVILAAMALPFIALGLSTRSMVDGYRAEWEVINQSQGLARPTTPHPPRPDTGPDDGFQDQLQHALLWLTLIGFFHLLARHRSRADQETQRARALQDQALRAKLAPHFIFNTLNTLKAQIAVDPQSAEATTDRLASLFRQVVQVADQPTIPLKQELAFVEAYLGIEQARLGNRLTVVLDIPEDLDDHPVPPLALQVLVENAIKHGIAPFEQPGTVTIQAEATPQGLSLSVTDTGRGTGAEPGTGTALATLRQRLAKPQDLVLERHDHGFRASLMWGQA